MTITATHMIIGLFSLLVFSLYMTFAFGKHMLTLAKERDAANAELKQAWASAAERHTKNLYLEIDLKRANSTIDTLKSEAKKIAPRKAGR